MTRLIAFKIIGGTNQRPITKIVTAHMNSSDEAGSQIRYYFIVYQHDNHTDFMPSDHGRELYYLPCGIDYQLAIDSFDALNNVDDAKQWAIEDQEYYGEQRLFNRAIK